MRLPGITHAESWYGHGELKGGNKAFDKWRANTWHVALVNCPSATPFKMQYNITFDYIKLNRMQTSRPIFPDLKRQCPQLTRIKSSAGEKTKQKFALLLSCVILTLFL